MKPESCCEEYNKIVKANYVCLVGRGAELLVCEPGSENEEFVKLNIKRAYDYEPSYM